MNPITPRKVRLQVIRVLMILLAAGAIVSAQRRSDERWVGTWATAPHPPFPFSLPGVQPLRTITNRTIRMIVPASIGGQRVRVRFSNRYGMKPLTIGAAHIARHREKAAIVAGTDRVLAFGGKASLTIPPGAVALSDAVDLAVPDASNLSVSLYLPGDVEVTTMHLTVPYASYLSEAGDFAGAADIVKPTVQASWHWLESIDVSAPVDAGAIVAFGDSITDGAGSAPETNGSWPSMLARRVLAQPGPKASVLNLGISGNRILHDALGMNALARFDSDVLAQSGVRSLIVLEGINDIGFTDMTGGFPGGDGTNPFAAFRGEVVSADDIIGGLRQIIERARVHGIKVFGGTLLPYEGAAYFSQQGEAKRQAVNRWIRSSGAFDGVIDFDAAVRDPQHPTRFLPAYQSGDNLHPNNAGYKVMADAVNLGMLRGIQRNEKR